MLRLGMFHLSAIRSSRQARAVRKGIVQRTAQSVAPTPAKQEPAASHMNGTKTIAEAGSYPYTSPMTATLIGYARCSTDRQDPAAHRP